jgi:O-antigen ligase
MVVLFGLALAASLSRSAWLGLVASGGVVAWALAKNAVWRRRLLLGTLAGVVFCVGVLFVLRNNDHVQNVFFHSDEHSTSAVSSNSARANAMEQGLKDIVGKPFGTGVGSAGPASVYNSDHAARIAENYFVQVGQEVGIIGLGLFVAINALVFGMLWHGRDDPLNLILAASLVGLTAVNFLSHAWADDTLAYIWCGLAGIALSRNLLPEKLIKNVQGLKHKKEG